MKVQLISSSYTHNIDIAGATLYLQTHCHEDHFDPEMLISRHNDYGAVISNDLLIAGTDNTLKIMDAIISKRIY